MKFIGVWRIRDYVSINNDFRGTGTNHPCAVFSKKDKFGKTETMFIPLTSYKPEYNGIECATNELGGKIIVNTSTVQADFLGCIVKEVIVMKGRVKTLAFPFQNKELFMNFASALISALEKNDFVFHTHKSLNSIMPRENSDQIQKNMIKAIKRFWT